MQTPDQDFLAFSVTQLKHAESQIVRCTAQLTEQQMWQVSTLLVRADKLPPEVLDAFKPPSANAAAPASVTPAPAQTK